MNAPVPPLTARLQSASDRLNRTCLCVTLDRNALCDALRREAGDPDFCDEFISSRANLFSNVPVFLPEAALADMQVIVGAIEAASRIEAYRSAVLSWAPEIARLDHGPIGAVMGYDFHLTDEGPKLIEINTNAGGAFLNALLARAHRACCGDMAPAFERKATETFEDSAFSMFEGEWLQQRGSGVPGRIAIIDDTPRQQYLYPEFVLARRILVSRGAEAIIADARHLRYEGGKLSLDGLGIDLVYNRLTDFAFGRPEHAALREAYREGAVVVTPNPHNHALLADKRNPSLLSNPATLEAWGVPPTLREHLATIPTTVLVSPDNAGALWQSRDQLFFKPAGGHGGTAVYRGAKVTKGVWSEIVCGGYVAQTFIRPAERMIDVDGTVKPQKMDVRLYTYGGRTLLTAARLYRGQTTNFRTPGGGFAPVFIL